MKIAHKL